MEDTAVLYKHPNSKNPSLYFFRNCDQRDIFLKKPSLFSDEKLFPPKNEIPTPIYPHNAAQIITKEKNLANYCPVTLLENDKVAKGYQLFLVFYKDSKFVFETTGKMNRFLGNPFRYAKVTLPVKMPSINENITLLNFPELEDSVPFLEQSIGSIATRGLLEVTSFMSKDSKKFRLKYPTMSVRETALKLFAMFLKANNPSNTDYSKKKYKKKIKTFLDRCELPPTIHELKQKKEKGKNWTEYKEKYYHELGAKYDKILKVIDQERSEAFINYIR